MDIHVTEDKGQSQIQWSLQQNPLFSRLSSAQVSEINRFSREIELKKGDLLFHRGDNFINFYFVNSGLVKLFRQSPEGQEKILQIVGRGHFFAETLLFDYQSSLPFSAEAMQATTVVAINAQIFLNILKQSPETHIFIMGHLSQRIHELFNEIENLSLMSCRNRVASYFYDQALTKGESFYLDIPKNAIASLLSLKPETFSRLIKELCSKDIIQVKENHIAVRDLESLKQQVLH